MSEPTQTCGWDSKKNFPENLSMAVRLAVLNQEETLLESPDGKRYICHKDGKWDEDIQPTE